MERDGREYGAETLDLPHHASGIINEQRGALSSKQFRRPATDEKLTMSVGNEAPGYSPMRLHSAAFKAARSSLPFGPIGNASRQTIRAGCMYGGSSRFK
jgi:hypothetical protein